MLKGKAIVPSNKKMFFLYITKGQSIYEIIFRVTKKEIDNMLRKYHTKEKTMFFFRKVGKEEIKKTKYLPDYGWTFNWLH